MSQEIDVDVVCRALEQPRPGLEAQKNMMPRPRATSPDDDTPVRQGGVLLLLYPVAGQLHLVLTRRTEDLPSHKGQISLPGGARHAGESPEETALREAQEELAVEPATVQVLGRLSRLYIPPSHYCIHPVVGHTPARPAFRPNPYEVAEVLEVALTTLLDPATVHEEDWELRGMRVRVPFFELNEHKVWGATAMVLSEFVALIRATDF
jgi:8-oxo-dGTP pyrophosphatase MutT (NUDIX family)